MKVGDNPISFQSEPVTELGTLVPVCAPGRDEDAPRPGSATQHKETGGIVSEQGDKGKPNGFVSRLLARPGWRLATLDSLDLGLDEFDRIAISAGCSVLHFDRDTAERDRLDLAQ